MWDRDRDYDPEIADRFCHENQDPARTDGFRFMCLLCPGLRRGVVRQGLATFGEGGGGAGGVKGQPATLSFRPG